MFTYAPLMATLHKRKISKVDLQKQTKISSSTLAKIGKDEFVSMKVLNEICHVLHCEIEDIIAHVKEENHQL
ncbi:helix-turn-helix transcriptional regulator [Peribacillus frigoritolerans]|uniref:helix-turn-helix domain-containing protein n=1 Tax=Peribacillus frigoritolerans TaxID=450367 RepID=UPI002E20F577|nr:helix-turn-helix transcriptional regulator [Peribacillus frigoritolerans]